MGGRLEGELQDDGREFGMEAAVDRRKIVRETTRRW
jgi:hypothetical protein